MKHYDVPGGSVWTASCGTPAEVRAAVEACLDTLAPRLRGAGEHVFLKPSLDSDRPGLSGATTDLRLLVAVVEALQDRGIPRIFLSDAPLPPYARAGIRTLERLRVDRLVRRYRLHWVDVSRGPFASLSLPASPLRTVGSTVDKPVRVHAAAQEAGLLLHLPSLTTHPTAGLAMSAWHLLGLLHPDDRQRLERKPRHSLGPLARALNPGITLLDGLVVMEGEGPLEGTPVKLDRLFWSADPLRLDLLVARMLGHTPEEVPYLWTALYEHWVGPEAQVWVEQQVGIVRDLSRPAARGPARTTGELVQGWLRAQVRRRAERRGWARLAERLSLRAHVDPRRERLHDLRRSEARCGECRKCEAFCPTGLPREQIGATPVHDRCLECLYCLQVCDRGALEVSGEGGAVRAWLELHKAQLEAL